MIQLQDIEFSPCSVSWDEDKNKFRKNTKDEIYLCCDKKCDKYKLECDKFCHENHKKAIKGKLNDCLFSCHVMGNVCDKMCQSARFDWDHKYFDKCLDQAGCLKNEYLDNQCLINKKDDLLNCCLRNCQPEKDLNCEQHCGISYDINLERSIPYEITKNYTTAQVNNIKKENGNSLSVPLFILFIILIILIFIFFKIKWLNTNN
jgi:hypothetical protein